MDLRASVATKQQLLTSLQRSSAVSTGGGAASEPAAQQSLVLLIAQTAQAGGVSGAITSSRPDGPNNINVSVQNASFDALLGWLVVLQQSHGVSVQGASLNSTRQVGLVSGQLSLSRG